VDSPYCTEFAALPMISIAPRLAAMNAKPVIHPGKDRPDRKKSSDVATARRASRPIPTTK
jgi:hypothetical protein